MRTNTGLSDILLLIIIYVGDDITAFGNYLMMDCLIFLHRHKKHHVKRLKSCQSVATLWSRTLLDFPEILVLGFRQMTNLPLHALRPQYSMATRHRRR